MQLSPLTPPAPLSQPLPSLRERGETLGCCRNVFLALPLLLAAAAAAEPADESNDGEGPEITVQEELLVEDRVPYLPRTATTASKTETPFERLPVSVSALSHDMLRDRNALVLGDALASVPGVHAQSNSGVHDLFFIRGFDSLSSGLVMTDGAPEPEAIFYQLYNVERIEVVRGPSGFLYGGNPIAGAVNLVRKRPTGGTHTRVEAMFGDHSSRQITLDLNYGRPDGGAGLRLNGLSHTSNGHRDDKESEVVGINPVYTFRAGRRTAVTVSADVLSSEFSPDAGIPLLFGEIPDVPRQRSYQTPFDVSDQDLLRLRLDVDSRLGELTLRNKTYVTVLDWQSKGTLLQGAFPDLSGGVSVFRTRNVLDDRQRFLGHQVDLLVSRTTGSVRHELLAGLELAHLSDDLQLDFGLLPQVDLFDPVETAPADDVLLPGFGITARARTFIAAPYVLDTLHLSERWQLFLGGRFDVVDFEDAAADQSLDDSRFSPFAGLLFAPSKHLSLYANYSEAFSPPSTTVPAGQRDSEEGRNLEAGLKASLGGLRLALGLYRLEKDNIAIVDATGVAARLGAQQSTGAELELAGSAGELHWTLSYAYTDAELTRFRELDPIFGVIADHSGNTPPYAPEHLASLWIHQRFRGGLRLAGGARYVGEQFIAPDNRFAIDDYLTVDALVSLEYHRWGARIHLRNLTEEDYEGRGFGNSSVLPADGFNIMWGLHFDL